jgi:LuxR family maltose regulon positive regulatory protein
MNCRPSERSEPSFGRRDELSERELEVLRYLPTMLTASEIAAQLYISVNTIKAHTRSIYAKLGASRRQDAVVRAYEWGILGP